MPLSHPTTGCVLHLTASLSIMNIICTLQVTQLDPASHAYSFWEGVPPAAKEAFGRLFALSETLQVNHRIFFSPLKGEREQ